MWLRLLALGLGVLGLAVLLASGPGVRLGLWDWRSGLGLLRYAAYLGIAAFVASVVALLVPRVRRGGVATLAVALALGVASLVPPLLFQRQARSAPPIHDITTDTADPPQFAAVLPLRAGAANPPGYAGAAAAELQRQAYPDIAPIVLPLPAGAAFARAADTAERLGWHIVARDAAGGRIEAVASTAWFGFQDDVVVRVRAQDRGSRIDVRSKSRVGRGDAGANAGRIRAFRAALLE